MKKRYFLHVLLLSITTLFIPSCGGSNELSSNSPQGFLPIPVRFFGLEVILDEGVSLFFTENANNEFNGTVINNRFVEENGTVFYQNNGLTTYADATSLVNDENNTTNRLEYNVTYDALDTSVTTVTVEITGSGFTETNSTASGFVSNDEVHFGGNYSEPGQHLELIFEFQFEDDFQTLRTDPFTTINNLSTGDFRTDVVARFTTTPVSSSRIQLERELRSANGTLGFPGTAMTLSTRGEPPFISFSSSASLDDAIPSIATLLPTDDVVITAFPYVNNNGDRDSITAELINYREELLTISQEINASILDSFIPTLSHLDYGFSETINIEFFGDQIGTGGNSNLSRAEIERTIRYNTEPGGTGQLRSVTIREIAAYRTVTEDRSGGPVINFAAQVDGNPIAIDDNNNTIDIRPDVNVNLTSSIISGAFTADYPSLITIELVPSGTFIQAQSSNQ